MKIVISSNQTHTQHLQYCVQVLLATFFLSLSVHLFAQDRTCTKCHGRGIITFQYGMSTFGINNSKKQCPICHQWVSAGSAHSDPCPKCNGTGRIPRPVTSTSKSNSYSTPVSNSSSAPVNYNYSPNVQYPISNATNINIQGYDGFMEQNNCYGNIVRYFPNNHVYLNDLTNKIKELNRCRTGAFSSKGNGVIVFDNNGFQAKNIPQDLLNKLFEINKNQQDIRDVAFSENGTYWCVIYNINGWYAYSPKEFQDRMNDMISRRIGVRSVALDDYGNYVIVGDDGSVLCSPKYQQTINEARNKFGKIISASVTNSCYVFCCERGVYFNGIQSSVADILKKTSYIPKVVKITSTGHYLITDGNNACWYWF